MTPLHLSILHIYYNPFSMLHIRLYTVILTLQLLLTALSSPVDLLLGHEYHGQYVARQAGVEIDKCRKLLTTWKSVQGRSLCISMGRRIERCSIVFSCSSSTPNTSTARQCLLTSRASSKSGKEATNGPTTAIPSPSLPSGTDARTIHVLSA